MKRSIGVITLLIIILGWCASANATNIVDLGTVQYSNTQEKVLDIEINSTQLVDLNYISSDVNKSALYVDNRWFSPLDNKTTYIFATKQIKVEWWFINDTKSFIYQDNSTMQLYRVNINYSKITIPENPYTKQHRELKENYTLILNNYNLTNETLANITLQFNELDELYNLTIRQFNMTLTENQNLSGNLTNMTIAFNELDIKYNQTDALWKSAIDNVTYYQTKYDGKVTDYNQLEKDHNNLAGAVPWYIILSIMGTLLVIYIYTYWKKGGEMQPEATDEITTSYGKLHSAIDKHILSRFRGEQKTGNEGGIEEIEEWKEVNPGKNPQKDAKKQTAQDDDILTIVHKKIDENTRMMTKQFTDGLANLDKKIDKIISERA